MSHILSPIEDINRINIEPFPTNRLVRVARVVRVDGILVAVDEKGRIYSSQVDAHCAYSFGCDFESTLRGLLRLRMLSKAAVKQHHDLWVLRQIKRDRKQAANLLEQHVRTLGLKLTNAQRGAIDRARAEG